MADRSRNTCSSDRIAAHRTRPRIDPANAPPDGRTGRSCGPAPDRDSRRACGHRPLNNPPPTDPPAHYSRTTGGANATHCREPATGRPSGPPGPDPNASPCGWASVAGPRTDPTATDATDTTPASTRPIAADDAGTTP